MSLKKVFKYMYITVYINAKLWMLAKHFIITKNQSN